MAFVPAPNIVMLEFRYTMAAQRCENRIMVNNLAAPDVADLEAIATLGRSWAVADYMPNVGNNTTLVEVVATDLSVQDGEQFTLPAASGTVGGKGSPLPNEAAFCISLRSTSRGRSARGRWYAGSLSGNDRSDPNTLTTVYANDISNALVQLQADISTAGKDWVIVSYRTNNEPRPGGPVYYSVESVGYTDLLIDSMRRRKPGVGS